MQQRMHKSRFNGRKKIPVLSNIHQTWPKNIHILCNIAHFLVYIQRLLFKLFLVCIMLWYNKDCDIKDNFYLIYLIIYCKMKEPVPVTYIKRQIKIAATIPIVKKLSKKLTILMATLFIISEQNIHQFITFNFESCCYPKIPQYQRLAHYQFFPQQPYLACWSSVGSCLIVY